MGEFLRSLRFALLKCSSSKLFSIEWPSPRLYTEHFMNCSKGLCFFCVLLRLSLDQIYPYPSGLLYNLQANVSATARLFGGDSSRTPFFWLAKCSEYTWYLFIIQHMQHINVLDFDDKSDRNWCAKFMHFHSRKCIWKCRLENGSHLVSASMC